jgi:hypothetical protein
MSVGPGLPDFTVSHTAMASDTLVIQESAVVIAPGTELIIPPVAMSSVGYAVSMDAVMPAGTANPLLRVFMGWSDPATSLVAGEEQWFTPCAASAPGAGNGLIIGRGPTKAGQLGVSIHNFDVAQSATVDFACWQTGRLVTRDDWRSMPHAIAAGPWLGADYDPWANVLAFTNNSGVAAGTTSSWLIPMFAGQASLTLSANTYPGLAVTVTAPLPDHFGVATPVLWQDASLTGPVSQAYLSLPRCPAVLSATNSTGGTILLSWSVTLQEYAS